MSPVPSSHRERDEQILTHIGIYRVSLRAVLSCEFFGGRTPGNVLQRLMREGRVTSRRGLVDNLRYYQLTAAEVNRRGLPLNRAKPVGPQALHTNLAVLWYCCMLDGPRRQRLESSQMDRMFGDHPPPGLHCGEATTPPRVVRVLTPNPGTRATAFARRLLERHQELSKHKAVRELAASSQYAVMVLTQGPAMRARLCEVLQRHERAGTIPTEVALVPPDRALAAAARTTAGRDTP